MRDEAVIALKGYDSYEIRLGDELRGDRASMGKSLLDVQRELRIRAAYIDAIENCDASVFPNPGFIAGYVRAYARYLGRDVEDVFRRFCGESGFQGVNADLTGPRAATRPAPGRSAADEALARSRFARPNAPGLSLAALSGLGSVAVLAFLVAGIGYGGFYVLTEMQRLGFAPVPQVPEILAAPVVANPPAAAQEESRAPLGDPARDRTLTSLYAPRLDLPKVEPRDGPIATLDPDRQGLFAPAARPVEVAAADPGMLPGLTAIPADPPAAEPAPVAPPSGVVIVARDSAWVRVFLADGTVLFEQILKSGESWAMPPDAGPAFLRAGNAGAVFLQVGPDLYGPLGKGSSVVRKVALDANEIAASWPRAEPAPAPAVILPAAAPAR
jgi:hypothetical protein